MSTDERLKKAAGESKSNRAMDDRAVTQNRTLSEDDRLAEFLGSFQQSHLPDLPDIPGFHVCWLTTTSSADPVHARLRAGYQLLKAEDIPGWSSMSIKTGEYAGMIGVNEMVAAKLPIDAYQKLMTMVHHDKPKWEESRLRENVDEIRSLATNVQPVASESEDGWR